MTKYKLALNKPENRVRGVYRFLARLSGYLNDIEGMVEGEGLKPSVRGSTQVTGFPEIYRVYSKLIQIF
jgi:hypothetical protein